MTSAPPGHASSWVTNAEAALEGRGTSPGITLLTGRRPPLLDGEGSDALTAPLFAGFLWAAAFFLEAQSGQTAQVALLLRWLALGLSVRALRLVWRLLLRVKLWVDAPRYALAIADEGLLLRTPTFDIPLAKVDVVSAVEQGDWRTRSGRRFHQVYLVTKPSTGRLFVALPPVLDDTPGLLAERLMRWCEPPSAEPPAFPPPDALPSKVYEEAARGEPAAGVIALAHGNAWLERGPYFTVLLGVTLLERWLHLGQEARVSLGLAPVALIATCILLVPVIWHRVTLRLLSPRRGLSLVLTPAEMLLRTGSGIHRVAWREIKRVTIESRRSWAILSGTQHRRNVLIERREEPEVRYDEIFLGAPAEVVTSLLDAYRRGLLP